MKTHDANRTARASVVVLACGSAETTSLCLEYIAASVYPDLEICVICNGRDAELESGLHAFEQWVASRGVRFRGVVNESNLGACTGRNQALELITGDYVAFLDNDVFCMEPLWLYRAVQLLESDPSIGMVGPRLLSHAEPARIECAGYAVDASGRVIPLGAGRAPDTPRLKRVRTVQACGNFVARTQIMREIGGFDVAFDPFGFENVDCCYRVKAGGMTVVCDGGSDLRHVGHATTARFPDGGKQMLFSKSLLFRKRWKAAFERERQVCERLLAEDAAGLVAGEAS